MNNSKIKVAVVGTGYWGKNLVRNFSALGCLYAVCDNDSLQAEKFSKEYNVKASSWQQVLGNKDIDAVALAVPAVLHFKFAKEALLAGKHVFVEKPIAMDIAEGKELTDLALKQQKILMVGHILQYHSAFQALKELVHSKGLGKIQYIYSNRLSLGKVRKEEDVLWSFAPHDISMILALTQSEPSKVTANASCILSSNIADIANVKMTFNNGIKAHALVSWMNPFKEQKLVVIGKQAMAVFDDTKPWSEKLAIYSHEYEINQQGVPSYQKKDAEFITLQESEPLKEELKHFIDCICNNKAPITNGNEATRVLSVLRQASLSMQNKREEATTSINSEQDYFVHSSSIVDKEATIGQGTKIWHYSHILSKTSLGENCVIGQNVMIGPDVKVGNNCKIQNNVSLYKGVELGDGVFCGPSCVFTNVNNPRAEIERKDEFKKTKVHNAVTIGANATIICGVELGQYSFIGAGAVVTKDVAPFALVVGNPAKQIGWVSHSGERLDDSLICPRDGRQYQVVNNQLEQIVSEPC